MRPQARWPMMVSSPRRSPTPRENFSRGRTGSCVHLRAAASPWYRARATAAAIRESFMRYGDAVPSPDPAGEISPIPSTQRPYPGQFPLERTASSPRLHLCPGRDRPGFGMWNGAAEFGDRAGGIERGVADEGRAAPARSPALSAVHEILGEKGMHF